VSNVKTLKTLTAIAVTVVLSCGLSGCTVASNKQATLAPRTDVTLPRIASPTPRVNATQTAIDAEVVGPSEEVGISREEDSLLTPSPPTQVTARATAGVIVLVWLGTGDDRIEYYQVYRKIADDEDWQLIARVEAIGDNRGWYEFRDTSTERGITYIYGVSAVDTYGNESTISESPAITSQ
jgi:hypothetical protein